MKISQITLISLFNLSLIGCAGLLPKEERTVQFVDDTGINKSLAYKKALIFFAKNIKDSNSSIKMQDENSGQIVTQGNITCGELKNWGNANDYFLAFNLDFSAKDNKIRLLFEDLRIMNNAGKEVIESHLQITDKKDIEKVKKCLEPIRLGILKTIKGNDQNW